MELRCLQVVRAQDPLHGPVLVLAASEDGRRWPQLTVLKNLAQYPGKGICPIGAAQTLAEKSKVDPGQSETQVRN